MLDPSEARLRDILRWLTTPARCGFYFSHADIARIGGRSGLRGAPTSRVNLFEQIIRAAALDERVDELFSAIRREMEAHLATYETCGTSEMEPWIRTATNSIELWGQIESSWSAYLEEIDDAQSPPPD